MNPTGDAHLILHHARHAELAAEARDARVARSVRRDRGSVLHRTVLLVRDRIDARHGIPSVTPDIAR